jgi:hypothetical protein
VRCYLLFNTTRPYLKKLIDKAGVERIGNQFDAARAKKYGQIWADVYGEQKQYPLPC